MIHVETQTGEISVSLTKSLLVYRVNPVTLRRDPENDPLTVTPRKTTSFDLPIFED